MAKLGIENNGVFIGAMNLPNKKKPCFVVERKNTIIQLGTFSNVESVKDFEIALKELLGGKE